MPSWKMIGTGATCSIIEDTSYADASVGMQ